MRPASSNREAVQPVVRLCPPAVQHGKIQASVENHLLATCARSFQRAPGIVEPHIHTTDEMASHVDVVILNENEFAREARIAPQFGDLLQHSLAGLVARMRFAREHELDGTRRILDDRSKPLDICQDQIRSFVSDETPRESDGECVLAQHTSQRFEHLWRLASTRGLVYGAAADELQELSLQIEVRFPKLAVVHTLYALPKTSFAAVLVPAGS